MDKDEILTEIRKLQSTDPVSVWDLYHDLEDVARAGAYPAVELINHPETEDGEEHWGFRCPHCGVDLDNYNASLRAVDVAERWTSAEELEDAHLENRTVYFWYDGYGDYEGLGYLCDNCFKPVTLPEGWTEEARY